MTYSNQRKDALHRVRSDRDQAAGRDDSADKDRIDPNLLPPRADQFHITDLQLWIDLSA